MGRLALAAASLLLTTMGPGAALASGTVLAALERGDAAYQRRAEQLTGRRASPDPIASSIAAYEEALAADDARVDVHWRLLRALYYRGDFAEVSDETRRQSFERGRVLADRALAALAALLGGTPAHELPPEDRLAALAAAGLDPRDVARVYFWAAVHWGAWSRDAGLLAAVREGVATRIRDYAGLSAALEPDYERGGAHRLLARLHATLPRVPFISGWVDRERAVVEAERALAQAPEDSGNRFLLAITLLELAPERKEEARTLLVTAAAAAPRPELLAEDLAVQESARQRLERLD